MCFQDTNIGRYIYKHTRVDGMKIEITPTGGTLIIPLLLDDSQEVTATNDLSHHEIKKRINNNEYTLKEIEIQKQDDALSRIVLDIGDVDVDVDVKHTSEDQMESIPPVPTVNESEMTDQEQRWYRSMQKAGNQAAIIRRTIYSNGTIEKGELKRILNEHGFDGVRPGDQHTGVNTTLRVLENCTDEITRDGRGQATKLTWTG